MSSRIALVFPIVRLPSSLGPFSYRIPPSLEKELCEGQLVNIPFRKRTVRGIVWNIQEEEKTFSGTLAEIAAQQYVPTPLILPEQRRLIEWFSHFYFVSPSRVLSFLPLPPQRKRTSLTPPSSPQKKKLKLSDASLNNVSTLWHSLTHDTTPALIRSNHLGERLLLMAMAGREAVAQGHQILILCPTLQTVAETAHTLSTYFPEKVVVFHGSLNATDSWNAAHAISSGSCSLIVGTRSALFLPFRKLGDIFIDHAERREYKQYDMHPRYDGRLVSRQLASLHHARMALFSATPRLEEEAEVRTGTLRSLTLSTTPPTILYAPLTQGASLPASFLLTDELIEAIRSSFKKNANIFLLLNAKSSSTAVRCRSCNHVFSCPVCKKPFRFMRKEQLLWCARCFTKEPFSSSCPLCKGVDLFFVGAGVERLAETVRAVFPAISVVSFFREEKLVLRQKTDAFLKSTRGSIIIGTSALPFSFPDFFATCSFAAVCIADPFPAISDFRSVEWHWQLLGLCETLARTYSFPLLLQSFEPISYSVDELLREREDFHLPPFSRLITLRLKKKSSGQQTLSSIGDDLTALSFSSHTLSTQEMTSRFQGDNPFLLITLTAKSKEPRTALPEPLRVFLKNIEPHASIDIDPLSFYNC